MLCYMKRVCDFAKVTSVSDEYLKDSNKELGLERAQLRFQFVGGSAVGASGLISEVDTANGGSKLVDVSSQDGDTTKAKCKALLSKFNGFAKTDLDTIAEKLGKEKGELTDTDIKSFRFPRFTVYTFTISELTDGKHSHVNNGVRNYSTMSTTYLNEHNDKTEAFEVVRADLDRRLQNDYEFGKVDDDNEEGEDD